MNKTLLYLWTAVILGIVFTIVPLVIVAQIDATRQPTATAWMNPQSLGKTVRQLDGTYSSSNSDFVALVTSLVISLVIYTLVRRRVPRDYARFGVPRF